jgi:hypothetical protein
VSGFEETYFIELKADEPESWKEGVRHELRKVECRRVGKLLLNAIRLHQRWVRIRPLDVRFATFNGIPLADVNCNARAAGKVLISGGRRYLSQLDFSPEKFFGETYCAMWRKQRGGALNELHETLFHELVHSYRSVSDTSDFTPVTGGLRWHTNRDEFIAILLTNIYASANGKKVLRADHRGRRALEDEFEGSFKFFRIGSEAFMLVDEFCKINKINRDFTKSLAQVNAPFNPIRAYYRDPEKVRKASQGKLATTRDHVGDNPMLEGMLPFVRT